MLLRNQLGAAIKLNSKEGEEEEDGTNIKDKNKAEGKSRYELGKKNKQGKTGSKVNTTKVATGDNSNEGILPMQESVQIIETLNTDFGRSE